MAKLLSALCILLLSGCLGNNDAGDSAIRGIEAGPDSNTTKPTGPTSNETELNETVPWWQTESFDIPAVAANIPTNIPRIVSSSSPYVLAYGQPGGSGNPVLGLFDPSTDTWISHELDSSERTPTRVWAGWTGSEAVFVVDFTAPNTAPAPGEPSHIVVSWRDEWRTILTPAEWASRPIVDVAISSSGLAVIVKAAFETGTLSLYSGQWTHVDLEDFDTLSTPGVGHVGAGWLVAGRLPTHEIAVYQASSAGLSNVASTAATPTSKYSILSVSETNESAAMVVWQDVTIDVPASGFMQFAASSLNLEDSEEIGPEDLTILQTFGSWNNGWILLDTVDAGQDLRLWRSESTLIRCEARAAGALSDVVKPSLVSHRGGVFGTGRISGDVAGQATLLNLLC